MTFLAAACVFLGNGSGATTATVLLKVMNGVTYSIQVAPEATYEKLLDNINRRMQDVSGHWDINKLHLVFPNTSKVIDEKKWENDKGYFLAGEKPVILFVPKGTDQNK